MKHLGLVVAICGLGFASAQAAPMTIDFDTANGGVPSVAGNIAGTEFTDFGLTIGLNPSDASSTLALFESNCGPDFPVSCTGNDGDLASGATFGTSPQGRVLIINEGTDANPNDDPSGGSFIFSFARPVTFLLPRS